MPQHPSPRDRFLVALDQAGVDRAALAGWMARVLEGLSWLDPDGEVAGESPADLLLCSTFGETLADTAEVVLGRFTLRYPSHLQQRSAGLVCVDTHNALVGTIEDLVLELVGFRDDEADALCELLALRAAEAAQPEGQFKWTGRGVSQAYRVVGEVESWPGQIQLQAARVYEEKIRIGDELWMADRELLPVCWVLDWIAAGSSGTGSGSGLPRVAAPLEQADRARASGAGAVQVAVHSRPTAGGDGEPCE